MRIHDPNLTGASAAHGPQETQRSDRAGGSGSSGALRSDRVEISGAAGSIARAMSANSSERAGRVRELAAEYESGRFQPDAAATSRAMIADALGPV